MTSRRKNEINPEEMPNLTDIKIELQKLKLEYEKQLQIYKESSKCIIEAEEKFNNISKKINKVKYKQMNLTNKIDNDYINNLNNYKIEQNIKNNFLTLLGFPFPNEESFYFDSPDNLISQLSLSKDFLFDLLITNKNEYDAIKSNYDNLNKDINILRPINDYIKLNFDIINLLQKRETIYEQNKKYIKEKDNSMTNVKVLKKKIKNNYSAMKKILKPNRIQKKNEIQDNILTQRTKDLDEITNSSHLLSIKDFDEISGKSFILSLSNDNSILDLFNEDEINKFEVKNIEHKYYNNSNLKALNKDIGNNNNNNLLKNGRNIQRYSKSPETNSNLLTEEIKKTNQFIKKSVLVEKYRSPQHKKSKGKDTLQIETPVGDNGCCVSCT